MLACDECDFDVCPKCSEQKDRPEFDYQRFAKKEVVNSVRSYIGKNQIELPKFDFTDNTSGTLEIKNNGEIEGSSFQGPITYKMPGFKYRDFVTIHLKSSQLSQLSNQWVFVGSFTPNTLTIEGDFTQLTVTGAGIKKHGQIKIIKL